MSTAKKATAPLSLPERPPSKVEAALAAADAEDKAAAAAAQAEHDSPEAKRERAIEAMVEAGLSREFAEASFVLAEDGADVSPADVAAAVGESAEFEADHGAPLCSHGCHGQSWADVRPDLDAVSCEHGSFPRKPTTDK